MKKALFIIQIIWFITAGCLLMLSIKEKSVYAIAGWGCAIIWSICFNIADIFIELEKRNSK